MSEAAQLFTDGKAYERMMGRWSQIAGKRFLDWIDPPKNLSWIDVGCGNGAFTEVLIERCAPAAVTGIDPSDGQLAYAHTRPGTRMAQFKTADAQSLPFADNSFDAASMALVITFIPDPVKAAREIARTVRPRGFAATYMWDFEAGGFPLRHLLATADALHLPTPVRPNVQASGRDGMRKIWEQAGFTSIEMEVLRATISYSGFDDYWQSNGVPVGTTGKAISELPPAELEKFKAHLRKCLPTAPDGRIAFEAFANAVKGRFPG